jgi:hypothetical protein
VSGGRRFFVAVPVMGALVFVGVGISPSLARPSLPGSPGPTATTAQAHDQFFAGRSYQEAGPAEVSVEFVVPSLTCTGTNTGVAAGAFIYTAAPDNPGSNQTLVSAASVQLFCLGGEPAPLPAVEVEGRQTYGSTRPHVGDKMRATIIDSARGLGVTLQDLTQHHTFTVGRSGPSARATAAAVGDVPLKGVPSLTPGPLYPITDFGPIRFAGRINGELLGAAGGRAFSMVSGTKVLQIRTGPLTGRGPMRSRGAFTTFWKHS